MIRPDYQAELLLSFQNERRLKLSERKAQQATVPRRESRLLLASGSFLIMIGSRLLLWSGSQTAESTLESERKVAWQ